MQLIHSPTSPYARKVRILIREKNLDVEEIATVPFDDEENLHAANPLGKVPALITSNTSLFDSPVICEYLDALDKPWLGRKSKAHWQQKTLHALGDGIIDAVLGFRMERIRPQELWWDFQAMRQENAVGRVIVYLEANVDKLGAPWGFGNLAIACGLGYLDFRAADMHWRTHAPKLAKWFAAFELQESYQNTAPPQSSPPQN